MSSTLNMLSLKSQRDPQVEMSSKLLANGFSDQESCHHRHIKVDEVWITYGAQVEQKEGLDRKPE